MGELVESVRISYDILKNYNYWGLGDQGIRHI